MKHGEGQLDDTIFDAAAQSRAREAGEDGETAVVDAYFLFRVGGTRLAVPALRVESVADVVAPMRVPYTPAHILGLVLHGEVALPVVDLAVFFGLDRGGVEEVSDISARRVVFVRDGEMVVGLLCDRATGVRAVDRGMRQPAEVLKGGRLRRYLEAELEMADARVGVMDLGRFIDDARVRPDRDDAHG